MDSLKAFDLALFRFINLDLKNAFFDWLLPYFNSNVLFVPILAVVGIWLVWRGGMRGRLFVCFMLLTFVIGDPIIVRSLKNFIDRPRPFDVLTDIHLLVHNIDNPSMPSGHAANWFAAAMVSGIYYRRSLWFMLPMAFLEAFSRVYLGVHYPSDVTAGAMIGIGYAILTVWISDFIWNAAGPRWFPIWHEQVPSLIHPTEPGQRSRWTKGSEVPATEPSLPSISQRAPAEAMSRATLDQHWLRLGYVLLGAMLLGHFAYFAADRIELSAGEAVRWLWSKHLDFATFDRPPLVAYLQYLGVLLWGDTVFGVRFFAPVLGALTGLVALRWVAREANGFVACMLILTATATPLLMAGFTLMTPDSLAVLFWMAALASGWTALQHNSTRAWMWTGVWMGLGALSSYLASLQWICWFVFFAMWPSARREFRRPGLYVALLIYLIFLLPAVIWNARNEWITLSILASRAGLDRGWTPTLRYAWEFIASEAALLNPVFFVGAAFMVAGVWRSRVKSGFMVYLFSMSAPLFLFLLLYSLRARVEPNWIAPAVLPLFALMLLYSDERWRKGATWVRHALIAGIAVGWVVVVPLHETLVIAKLTGNQLPVRFDPLTRVLGWKELARVVDQARTDLAKEGKPVFIIAEDDGLASLLSFYFPKVETGARGISAVFSLSPEAGSTPPFDRQSFQARKGENAIHVALARQAEGPEPPIREKFASIANLGSRDILFKNRVLRRIQLFACRDLR